MFLFDQVVKMNSNGTSILIVDDGQYVRDLLVEWLSHDYHCVSAGTVDEAARLLTTRSFNVVITDIMLPDGSGLAVCQIIRRLAHNTAIVAISGVATIQNQVQALCNGAIFFLTKPFDQIEIKSVVESALSHQARSSALAGVHS